MSDKAGLLELFAKKHKLTPAEVRAVADKLAPPLEITEEFLAEQFPPLCDVEIPSVEVIVEDHLIVGGILIASGMFESFKTMGMMELAAAIIGCRPAFEQFKVYKPYPVTLCCPDMHMSLVKQYATPFGLASKEVGNNFRVMSQKDGVIHAVDSPVMQRHVAGRILILDTMWDFAGIQKAFESGEWITFFQKLRRLITQFGCIAIIMLVHPTKSGARSSSIDPAEFLKDSVTFGGKIDAGFAFSKLPDTSQILVERIKGRGFKERGFRYTITTHSETGENYLDQGRFPVYAKPGAAGKKGDYVSRRGRKPDENRDEKIAFLVHVLEDVLYVEEKQKPPIGEITEALNTRFKSDHPESTVKTWLRMARKQVAAKASAAQQGTFDDLAGEGGIQ